MNTEKQVAFEAADAAGKRVMLAQEACARARDGSLTPERTVWLQLIGVAGRPDDTQVQAVIEGSNVCRCCAYGGMMAAEILINNSLQLKDCETVTFYPGDLAISRGDIGDRLGQFFSREQLAMIEDAFERGNGMLRNYLSLADHDRCMDYGERYVDDTDRFLAIMQNIIANGGEFRP